MKKLSGTLKVTIVPETVGVRAHFAAVFLPYAGRLATKVVKLNNHQDLANFLIDLRIEEDAAGRWAGKARMEGVVLISPFERTDSQLKEHGLLD